MGLSNRQCPVYSISIFCILLLALWVGVFIPEVTYEVTGIDHDNETIGSGSHVTWYAKDNPHNLTGTITINAGGSLTLEPGVIIQVSENQGSEIKIYGTLYANGTTNNKILIVTNSSNPSAFDWNGISFYSNSRGYFEYCYLNYSNIGIRCSSLKDIKISNTTIENCNIGIYITSGSPNIYDNYLTNILGTGVSVSGSATPNVYHNTIDLTGITGISILGTSKPNIYSNIINASGTNADGVSVSDSAAPSIYNNTISAINISGTGAEGIYYASTQSANVFNNTIQDFSTGIYVAGGSASIHHNSIKYSTNIGIKVDSSSATIYNNIVSTTTNIGINIVGSNPSANIYQNTISDTDKGISVSSSASSFIFNNN